MAADYLDNGNDNGCIMGRSSGKISFYGATTVAVQATAAAGTDAATTQTLANALRTAMLAYGLIA